MNSDLKNEIQKAYLQYEKDLGIDNYW